ncbi:hypothetical protein Daus18300_010716 [Diaporthe australafricana]|uniref:Cytochrome P450 n=1 Tax=Diaporthe australafricana TaxID=127596 RepID=A0ABR3W964_9PEZI
MTTLSMGTKTWVLLNSRRTVNEIIAKRAALTHERPYFPIAGGLVSHQNKRLFLQKTEQWKHGRQLLRQMMMGPGSKAHDEIIEDASTGLLRALVEQPWAWYQHTYRYPVAIMHKIVTGSHLQKSSVELADLQNVTSTFLTSINSSFVEFFPKLERLPRWLQFWRPHWESMGKYHYGVFKHWWNGWEDLARPSAPPSFFRDAILKTYAHSEEQAMYVAMVSMAAGSDNPRMTLNALLMACLCYPDVASKGRSEIDRLCGAERLPSLSDLPNLPYVCAMVKEVLRWRPTVPLVPQRVLVEDMEFEGYKFPRGTEFLVNTIAVCTSSDFEQPGDFIPERWLDDKEAPSTVAQEPWQFAFSAGKRSCIGYRLAQKEIFLALARILQCFDITARGAIDNTKLNAFSLGEPFPVQLTLRGSAYRDLVLAEKWHNTWGEDGTA